MRLTLNLTHACNLGCDYCFAGTARRQEMPAATGRESIDWAVRQAIASGDDRLEVSMMGGEPLLAFNLFDEFATYARRIGEAEGLDVQLQTTTNATLLDGHRLERLAELGAHVAISVDGVPDVHDRARRTHDGHGTGDAAWAALDRALARLESVSVVVVISPATVDELAATARALAARGVARIVLNPNWSAAWTPPQLEIWRAAYDGVAAEYVAAYRRYSHRSGSTSSTTRSTCGSAVRPKPFTVAASTPPTWPWRRVAASMVAGEPSAKTATRRLRSVRCGMVSRCRPRIDPRRSPTHARSAR